LRERGVQVLRKFQILSNRRLEFLVVKYDLKVEGVDVSTSHFLYVLKSSSIVYWTSFPSFSIRSFFRRMASIVFLMAGSSGLYSKFPCPPLPLRSCKYKVCGRSVCMSWIWATVKMHRYPKFRSHRPSLHLGLPYSGKSLTNAASLPKEVRLGIARLPFSSFPPCPSSYPSSTP